MRDLDEGGSGNLGPEWVATFTGIRTARHLDQLTVLATIGHPYDVDSIVVTVGV